MAYRDRLVSVVPPAPRGTPGAPGNPGATGPSNAFSVSNAGPTPTTADGVDVTVATLSGLPAGAYAISAKAVIRRLTGTPGTGGCNIAAESDLDFSSAVLPPATPGSVVTDELTHTFSGPGTVTLSCTATGGTTWYARNVQILAIKVDSETHTAVTG